MQQFTHRWVTIGQAQGHYYLVVVHTFRAPTEDAVTIRRFQRERPQSTIFDSACKGD